ncbi:MAG TPA: amidohydrolase [Gemmatales bacterium]|nr:amidohydrolase [Gemmatales bacterium]
MAAVYSVEDSSPHPLQEQIEASIRSHQEQMDAIYLDLHQNPELSTQEIRTARKLAEGLRQLGFDVHEKIGNEKAGFGVVGVLKNGEGPKVLVRTDLDALPIIEKTGVPYASQVRVRDAEGKEVGVMHACGHDIHMTCWLGTAKVLVDLKDRWQGTLIMIGQPSEERGLGAKAMLEAGLFTRFPKPDFCIALHADGSMAHGKIGYTAGMAMANVDSVDILVKGKGGHGSAPHNAIDPIVIASRIVLDLQTLVSRETDPLDSAVVTVGSIHGGSKHNIIPPEVKMQLTVRSFKDSVRKNLLEGIERIAKAAAQAARAPEPVVSIEQAEFTPSLLNDEALTKRSALSAAKILGKENVMTIPPKMGGEDFSRYSRDGGVPVFMFFLGTSDPAKVEESKKSGIPLPSMHSDMYAPVYTPSISTGVKALSAIAIDLFNTKQK